MYRYLILLFIIFFSNHIFSNTSKKNLKKIPHSYHRKFFTKTFFSSYNYVITGFSKDNGDNNLLNGKNNQVKAHFDFNFTLFSLHRHLSETGIYFRYIQDSFWNAYNIEESSPFFDNSYQPILNFLFDPHSVFFNMKNVYYFIPWISFEINHQSNGRRAGQNDRGWNRLLLSLGWKLSRWGKLKIQIWKAFNSKISKRIHPQYNQYIGFSRYEAELYPFSFDKIYNQIIKLKLAFSLGFNRISNAIYFSNFIFQLYFDPFIKYKSKHNIPLLLLEYYQGTGETLIALDQKSKNIRLGLAFEIY